MKQDIFWFQVTVDEAHEMEIFKRSNNLRGIKASCVLGDTLTGAGLQG
jgi:hypothetical protein